MVQEIKDFFSDCIFGQLPILTWDGEEYCQSLTIARYIARKVGLAGDSDEEMARADMITEQVVDTYIGGDITSLDVQSPG